ncbi:kinase-like domain-containing protein [Suillus clintonianus]|uniref:kinase-like domain-containing protein n=1 Tax=Suillus clintonianus TaxID=1904413 RepID=UPI001B87A15B|nr:kinase-like domain-containing protein [Suillus clintonianus]KAG2153880.1 kinase-like domain-containing protein [Suillus clintonianus]
MTGLVPVKENDLTSQVRDKLKSPAARGSFGQVYHCTDIETGKGKGEVAVKVFLIDDPRAKDPRAMEKFKKKMDRELKVWLRLEHRTIVPLLGIAHVESPLPALVSQWMSSGTLCVYLEKATLTVSAKGGLVKGVADGLDYLHSMNVIHGDLHPGNVLIDDSGNPCLTDFGLAAIEGEGELQLSSTTAAHSLNPRWRAPEVIGVENDPENPTFMSDIYSFGGVMLFIVSGDFPWKKKQSYQICIALSHKAIHARPENILNNHWELIQKCWSWDPSHRPRAAGILQHIDQFRTDHSQDRQPKFPRQGLADLTGQIIVTVNDFVAAGDFAVVYKGEWKRPTGPIKVAVKVIKVHVSELDLQRLRREAENWAVLVHENIIRLLGTTGFGPSLALVLPWFRSGTLLRLIAEQGAVLDIKSRLNLLHDIVSGLCHLHGLGVVHGDITSSNVLVDIKEGEYVACLTDIGLATVLGGCLGDRTIRGSDIRTGAIRWTAPELLKAHDSPADSAPTTQNDMYSFGRVMFHVITLVIPWNDISDIAVFQKILGGEDISRPVTSDMTTARWNEIAQCWSSDASARPSAIMAMDFLKSELEALADDDMSVDEVVESYRSTSFDAEQTTTSSNVMDPTRPISKAVQREIGLRTRDHRASVDTVTLHPSQGGSSKRTTAARPDTILDDHYNSNRQGAGNLTRNTKVLVSDPHQPPRFSNVHPTHSISKAAQSHSASANVNTVTPRTSQEESLRRPAGHPDTILQADHYNSTQQDTGNLMGNTKVPKCTNQPRNDDSQASIPNPSSLHALPLAEDLTGQIVCAISDYYACGAFGNVYRCEWRKPSGPVKVWPMSSAGIIC